MNKKNKVVSTITLGCKVNSYETTAIENIFIKNGYEINRNLNKKSDVYVINTCTVTNVSDRKSRKLLRHFKTLNKDAIIIATGCYVQVNNNLKQTIPEIDLIIGNHEKKDILKILEQYMEDNSKNEISSKIEDEKEFLEYDNVSQIENNRAIIKVEDRM